jgi:hypothetical protein
MKDPDRHTAEITEVQAQLHRAIDRLTERVNEIAGILRGQTQSLNQKVGIKTEHRRRSRALTRERGRRLQKKTPRRKAAD